MRRVSFVFCLIVLFTSPALFAQRQDPLTTFAFGLKIDGAPGDAGAGTAFFKSVSGLSYETEVVDYREGGVTGFTRKIPGLRKYGNITLKRGITADKSFATWYRLVEDGEIQQARKNGAIVLYDTARREVARWSLTAVWPSKIEIETNEETGEVMEVITLAVELIRRQ
jgi:phage tail-like protein